MTLEARLAALEQQYARLQAQQDIWYTITRYARGIDERRDDDLEAIFTDDAVLETHPWSRGPVEGKALVLKAFHIYQQLFYGYRRFITNPQISVRDDDTAVGHAYWLVVQGREGQSYCGWGTYEWDFRKEDDIWKIRKMIVNLECMTTLERGWGMIEERVVSYPRSRG
jgi:3-phenylpropionate/cinnamic acid dioxygenase small subunit